LVTYYNGFYYEVVPVTALGTNAFEGIIYDATQRTVVYRKGFSNTNAGTVTRALKDWIDINSGAVPGDIGDIEYDDLDNAEGVVYPHTMYDCETGRAYQARNPQQHMAMAAKGYVHDLSECKVLPVSPVLPPSETDIPESSGDNPILETAGVFVVGVAKGTLIAAVPITAMAVAVGFMRRIVRFGVGVSS
jgi:hypothetical protein